MGKRSSFERVAQDKYMTTDPAPVRRLQPHIPAGIHYAEPCAGKGDLIRSMAWHGHRCVYAGDIKPGHKRERLNIRVQGLTIEKRDARTLDKRWRRSSGAKMFVSNPPWTRSLMHELMVHLPSLLDTWLLLDADWMHTQQALPYLDTCSHVVSVGRVKWFAERQMVGLENAAWFFFPHRPHAGGPRFTGLS